MRVLTFLLIILSIGSVSSVASDSLDKISFDPFPNSEFAYYYHITAGNESSNQMHYYQGIKVHSLFNEAGSMYFTGVNKTFGPIAMQEVIRYQFICNSHQLKYLERSYSNYITGEDVTDDGLSGYGEILFADGQPNLVNSLITLCKLWDSSSQIANNIMFHNILRAAHNSTLTRMSSYDGLVSSLLFLIGPDYFLKYGDDNTLTKTQAYHQVLFSVCSDNEECWERKEIVMTWFN